MQPLTFDQTLFGLALASKPTLLQVTALPGRDPRTFAV